MTAIAHYKASVIFSLGSLTLANDNPVINALIVNPRRACAARVTVVGSVCLSSHISPMERLFILKTLSRTQRATKVKKIVGFSLKPLRCRDPALPPLHIWPCVQSAIFPCVCLVYAHAYFSCRMIHRRGFSTLVLFITKLHSYILSPLLLSSTSSHPTTRYCKLFVHI